MVEICQRPRDAMLLPTQKQPPHDSPLALSSERPVARRVPSSSSRPTPTSASGEAPPAPPAVGAAVKEKPEVAPVLPSDLQARLLLPSRHSGLGSRQRIKKINK